MPLEKSLPNSESDSTALKKRPYVGFWEYVMLRDK
jgi:hypothetical protein